MDICWFTKERKQTSYEVWSRIQLHMKLNIIFRRRQRKSMQDDKKRVILVQGGPGTGKTVVAINLLAQLTNEDQFCQYVSKNSAPRNVYKGWNLTM